MTKQNPTISTDSEDLASQDFYYTRLQKHHFWFASRELFLDELLKQSGIDLNGKRGLEIGCGNSLLSSQIENKYNCIVDGVDLTNPSFRFPTEGKFFQIDITQDSALTKTYDFLVLFDIIEHIENVNEFVNKAFRYLKPGGYIFVNVPAYDLLFSRYDKVAGHVRRYDSVQLRHHMTAPHKGAKVTEVTQIFWGFFFVPLVALRKLILSFAKKKSDEEVYALGFTPPNLAINQFLRCLAHVEKYLFLGTGFGTSIMGIYKKESAHYES